MQGIRIIAVGRLKEEYFARAQGEYIKRISRFCPIDIKEIPGERLPDDPSPAQIAAALKKEAAAVRGQIPPGYAAAALCVEGKSYDSAGFASLLTGEAKSRIAFIVGSSYGLDMELEACADHRISMSLMTFPHHLARIMLLEQIYRGYMIDSGGRYHK